MNDPIDQDKLPATPVDTTGTLQQVGSQLQASRMEQKLGLEEVAERLRLAPGVLSAIEAGDSGQLPAMTFIRGYIRSYARLLKIDEHALLAQLGEVNSQNSRPLTVTKPIRFQSRFSIPSSKWISRLLILCGVGVLLTFAYPAIERLLSSKQQSTETPKLWLPQPAGQLETTPKVNSKQENTTPDKTADPVIEQAVESTVKPAEIATIQNQDTPKKEAKLVELTLYCKQDSWVEVSAEGKQQQAGIMRAGTTKVIKAYPPFDILIGNAPAIEIKYNGEPFDTTPFWRGKVASFTFGN